MDTIFALSSGAPPAGIGIIRITGPQVRAALRAISGAVPEARRAQRAKFRDAEGNILDDGLVLFFPGPKSVTGEDLGELHCHGGRAVIAALETELTGFDGCRRAQPGEFTRRAFANGQIDLAEAEGLGDLLSAETEIQRRSAMAMATGAFSGKVDDWRETLLHLSAQVEASLDFAEEDDIEGLPAAFFEQLHLLDDDLHKALTAPHAETVKEGFRVALAGPPNAGKSTLFNALVESEAAITAELAGTTRDVLIRPVAMAGMPFTFVDMAGLRISTDDVIEAIGIERAESEISRADLVLWLGPEGQGPAVDRSDRVWEIESQCDRLDHTAKSKAQHRVSAKTGEGLDELRRALIEQARLAMPAPNEGALNARQRLRLAEAEQAICGAVTLSDPLILAEHLRVARQAFDALLGRTSTEEVLDAIFGRFCLGK